MKIGVVFPQTEFGNDIAALKEYVQIAEGLGYSHVLAYDHVLGANPDRPEGWRGPYTHQDPFHEVFLLFSFFAAITSRIEFTTGVLVLPQRSAILVAKQAAELDVLSGGRFRLGVGVGWNQVEQESLGFNFKNRGRRIEEQIEVMRSLWTQPLVTYKSQTYHLDDVGISPLPIQRPIPIWFGGHHDNVLRRVAKIGDGWMPGFRQAKQAQESLDKIAKYAEDAGRDPSELGLEPRMNYGEGDVTEWEGTIEGWQAAGATHMSINTMGIGLSAPADHIDAIQDFANKINLAGYW